jgi:hypothetical protein
MEDVSSCYLYLGISFTGEFDFFGQMFEIHYRQAWNFNFQLRK